MLMKTYGGHLLQLHSSPARLFAGSTLPSWAGGELIHTISQPGKQFGVDNNKLGIYNNQENQEKL